MVKFRRLFGATIISSRLIYCSYRSREVEILFSSQVYFRLDSAYKVQDLFLTDNGKVYFAMFGNNLIFQWLCALSLHVLMLGSSSEDVMKFA